MQFKDLVDKDFFKDILDNCNNGINIVDSNNSIFFNMA